MLLHAESLVSGWDTIESGAFVGLCVCVCGGGSTYLVIELKFFKQARRSL